MVRIALTTLALFAISAHAAPKKMRLSQKDVAELVLKQGAAPAEANQTFLQARLAPALVLSNYDWKAAFESGYQTDKGSTFDPSRIPGASYKRYITTATVSKSLLTGTLLSFEYDRKSQQADYSLASPSTNPLDNRLPRQTQDIFGITLEQSLLYNFLGRADRASVRAADHTFRAAEVARADDLQTAVLATIHAYWDAYVAEETFKEALASRDRYKTLVAQIKRKTSVGYSNPGEFSQAQAEFEGQEQSVKSASTDYLAKLESLSTLLNLPSGTEVEFAVDDGVPPVPKMAKTDIETLRSVRAQKLRTDAAGDSLLASNSKSYPAVNFVGKYQTSGHDVTADSSFTSMAAGNHPLTYVGVKVLYNFGSDLQTEDIINKKVAQELEETRLQLRRLQQTDSLAQAERKAQSSYAIVLSAQRQKEFREKAVKELTRTYSQGRTTINVLIDAINSQFKTETTLSRAVGDYQIALNEWAAARDELIPETKEEKK